jgi:phosphatidylserine synthase
METCIPSIWNSSYKMYKIDNSAYHKNLIQLLIIYRLPFVQILSKAIGINNKSSCCFIGVQIHFQNVVILTILCIVNSFSFQSSWNIISAFSCSSLAPNMLYSLPVNTIINFRNSGMSQILAFSLSFGFYRQRCDVFCCHGLFLSLFTPLVHPE